MRDSRLSDSLLSKACLVLGPLLFAASTFFWHDGRYGATGGALIALSMPVWTYGIIALLDGMRTKLPRYTAAVLLLTLFGALGGSSFGFQGFFETVYAVDQDTSLAALDGYPLTSGFLLWWIGPLFPAALFALGAGLIRTRRIPAPAALLMCLAALLFPLSRIPRIEWIAHVVDVLLLVPFVIAAAKLGRNKVETALPACT